MKKVIFIAILLFFGMSEVRGNERAREIECLALNIYHEARSEPETAQIAVAMVTFNRVADRRFPGTVCGVVKSRSKTNRRSCAFSWYCDGKSDKPKDKRTWQKVVHLSEVLYTFKTMEDITKGATHYHRVDIYPYWADTLTPVGNFGVHKFYKW